MPAKIRGTGFGWEARCDEDGYFGGSKHRRFALDDRDEHNSSVHGLKPSAAGRKGKCGCGTAECKPQLAEPDRRPET